MCDKRKDKKKRIFPVLFSLAFFSMCALGAVVHKPLDVYILFPDPNYNVTVTLNKSNDVVIQVQTNDARLDLWKLNKSLGAYASFTKSASVGNVNVFEYAYPSQLKKLEGKDVKPVMDKTLMRIGNTSTILYYEDNTANWWNSSYPYRINITCSKSASSVYTENEICKGWLQFPNEYAPQENTMQLTYNNNTVPFYRWYKTNNSSGHISRAMILLNTTLYPGFNKTYALYYSTSNASINSYNDSAPQFFFVDFNSAEDLNLTGVKSKIFGTTAPTLTGGNIRFSSADARYQFNLSGWNENRYFIMTKARLEGSEQPNSYQAYFHDTYNNFVGANERYTVMYQNDGECIGIYAYTWTSTCSLTDIPALTWIYQYSDFNISGGNYDATSYLQTAVTATYSVSKTAIAKNATPKGGIWGIGNNYASSKYGEFDWLCMNCRYNDSDRLDFYPEPNLQEWGLQWYGPRKSGAANRRIAYLRFSDATTPVGDGYDIENANYGNDWLDHGIAYLPQTSLLVSAQGNQARNITIKQSSDLGATWNAGVSIAVLKNTDENIYDIEIAPTEWDNVSLVLFVSDKLQVGGLKDGRAIGTDCTYTDEIGAGYFLFNHTSQAPVSDIWGANDIIGCWHEFDFLPSNISHLSLIPTVSKAGYDYFVAMDIKSGAGYQTVSKFLKFNPGYQLEGSDYSLLSGLTPYAQYPHAGADPIIDSALIVTMKNTTYTYNYSYWVAGSESEKGGLSVARSYGTSAPNTGLWGIAALRAPNSSSEWLFYDFFNDSNNNYAIGGASDTLTEAHTLTNVWNMTKSADNDALVRAYMDPQIVGIYASDDTYLSYLLVPTYSITQPVLGANYSDSLVNFRFALDFVPVGYCEIDLINNSSGETLATLLSITYNNPYTDQGTDYFRYGVTRNGYYYGVVKCFHPSLNRWTNGTSNVFYINNTPSNVTGHFTNPTQGYNFISEGSSFPLRHIYTGALTGCNATIINIDTLDEQANLNNLYTYGKCNNASDILAYLEPHVTGTINYRLYLSYVNELGALIMATDPYTGDPFTDFSITWTASSSITDNYECQNMFFRHAYYLLNPEQKAGANHIAQINIPKNYMLQGCDDIIVTNASWWQFYPYNSEFTKGNSKATCRTVSGCAYTEEYALGVINAPLYYAETNIFNDSLCLVSVLTNVSENAYYKIDALTGTWDSVNASNRKTMTELLSLGSFQINEKARSGVPYQTSYCDPRRITLALEAPNVAKSVWSIIENQIIRFLTNKDTILVTVTSGLPAMYLALLANATTIPATLASCNNCTNLTYTIAGGGGGGGGAGGWDDWAVEYGFDGGVAPTITRPFSTKTTTSLLASLPDFVRMPDWNNESFGSERIKITGIPSNNTNCTITMQAEFTEFLLAVTHKGALPNNEAVQLLKVTLQLGKAGNTYVWYVDILNTNYTSYDKLFYPFYGILAYINASKSGQGKLPVTAKYQIRCGNVSSDYAKVTSTLILTDNIFGDYAPPCTYAGTYGGCVSPDGEITFFLRGLDAYETINTADLKYALSPITLWNWISTPTSFVMAVMLIMIFMPILMAGR